MIWQVAVGVVGMAGIAAVVVLLTVVQHSLSRSLLQKWAEMNHCRVIEKRFLFFSYGPFSWTSTQGQFVYYVTIEDSQGNRRKGWVRTGDWLFGVFKDKVDVIWED